MGIPHTDVLFLDKRTTDALLSYPLVWRAVERVFASDGKGAMFAPRKEFIQVGSESQLFPLSACLYDQGIAGVKWTNFYPTNPSGYPTCWSHILILSRLEDGRPYAILDATSITTYRTAGGHAVVAAKYLANPGAKVLGVAGCGAQGLSAIYGFSRWYDLNEIRMLTGRRSRERCGPALKEDVSVPMRFVDSGAELAEDCDIIVTATTASHPLVMVEDVPEGCFVAGMYSFVDLDPRLSKAADKWVLGQRDTDREEILEDPLLAGMLREDDVYASLGEIVCGRKPGREDPRERIVFTHMGMASLDIAVADELVKLAEERGLGQRLRLN